MSHIRSKTLFWLQVLQPSARPSHLALRGHHGRHCELFIGRGLRPGRWSMVFGLRREHQGRLRSRVYLGRHSQASQVGHDGRPSVALPSHGRHGLVI